MNGSNDKPKKASAKKPTPKKKKPTSKPEVVINLDEIIDKKPSPNSTPDTTQRALAEASKLHQLHAPALEKVAKEFAQSLDLSYTQFELKEFTVGLAGLVDTLALVEKSGIPELYKSIADFGKIYTSQFAHTFQVMADLNNFAGLQLETLKALQQAASLNVSKFASVMPVLYDAKIGMFTAFEGISKLIPTLTIAQETFSMTLSGLQGTREVAKSTSVEISVKGVSEQEGQAAVGGKIITYKERGGYVYMRRGDFKLLVSTANNSHNLERGLNDIKKMLDGSDVEPVEVNARFTRITAELTLFGKTIKVSGSSHQASLCEVLFNDDAAFATEWHIDELLAREEFGEIEVDKTTRQTWIDRAYQWARQLNLKIAAETGKKDFLLVRDQSIYINPIYRP